MGDVVNFPGVEDTEEVPAPDETTEERRRRLRFGVTATGSVWHICQEGSKRFARCGITLSDTVELPPDLQPDNPDVCMSCLGQNKRRGGLPW